MKKTTSKPATDSIPASQHIDARIDELGDWRGEMLARVRAIIRQAVPDIVEEWKWRVPVWSRDGIVCTGETYKSVVKLTFAKGASLDDPTRLFNSSLEGNTRRAIDLHEGDAVDAKALKALVRSAAEWNASSVGTGAAKRSTSKSSRASGGPSVSKGVGKKPGRSGRAS